MSFRAWIPFIVIGSVVAVALTGQLGGGRTPTMTSSGNGVRLQTHMPSHLRSGLLFESRIELAAERRLDDATIGISPQVWSRVTINTIIPEPQSESFEDGEFRLHYGRMAAGQRLQIRLESQVNPSRFGLAEGALTARDGERLLVSQPHMLLVFP